MYPCYNFNPFRYGHCQNANPLLTSLSVDRHDDMLFCTHRLAREYWCVPCPPYLEGATVGDRDASCLHCTCTLGRWAIWRVLRFIYPSICINRTGNMYPCYNFNAFRYGHVQNASPLLTSLSVDRHDDMLFCTQLMRPCRVFVPRTCVNRKKI
jgi:hypothetical protein